MSWCNKTLWGVLGIFLILSISSCTPDGPQPIEWGVDSCVHCKMTISDARFGAEIITGKGRVYTFDDLLCLMNYVKEGQIEVDDETQYYVSDFTDHTLIPARTAYYLRASTLRSPMRGDMAAFSSLEDLQVVLQEHEGEVLQYADLWNETGG